LGSNPIAKTSPIAKRVTEEIRVYTEEDHWNGVDKNTRDLYSEIKSAILTLGGDVEVRKLMYAELKSIVYWMDIPVHVQLCFFHFLIIYYQAFP
jgi:hypothetical protein